MTVTTFAAKVSGTPTTTVHRAFNLEGRPANQAWSACGSEGRRMPKTLVAVDAPVNCPRCGADAVSA